MLSLLVMHKTYLPDQVILNKGDYGQHLYYIRKGDIEVNGRVSRYDFQVLEC